ncbi:MAG: succinylglutamate desuccinylase/aspartoacylase family protein [Thermodesulfobacteriota bacterium]
MNGLRARVIPLLFLIGSVLIVIFSGRIFLGMHDPEPIVKGPGVTEVRKLSHYLDNLNGSPGDVDVYFFEGEEAGGTFLVVGGTHPQETSGMMAAVLLIENAIVNRGRLIVIPQANSSGFTHTDPLEGFPHRFEIQTEEGSRWFRLGMRRANPVHHWPDPDIYVHFPSRERMAGDEIRNLNRAYPGRSNGSLMERMAYAIAQLIRNEGVDVTFDLHEAYPEYPVINMLVAHDRAMEIATFALFSLQMQGIQIDLALSPKNLHGLSHRELGDYTSTLAVLAETANPMMGRFRGRTDQGLIVEGKDPFYVRADKLGRLFVPFDENGHPLRQRVGRHLASVSELTKAYSRTHPDKVIDIQSIPDYETLMQKGIGAFLKPLD